MTRCPWCGHRCSYSRARTCHFCRDLRRLERAMFEPDPFRELRPMRDELREAVRGLR